MLNLWDGCASKGGLPLTRQSEMSRLIGTMSDTLHDENPAIDPLRSFLAATDVVTDQPGAPVERVWNIAEQLAHALP